MMWVKTFLGLLLCVLLQSNVCGASEIEGDLGLLKKDQRAQLRREIDWISQTKSWILLSNRKDSLRTSLVTHDATYSDAQKAYKRVLIWYVDQRLHALGISDECEPDE